MNRVFINGKFLSWSMRGVQRVAYEMLQALDDLVTEGSDAVQGLPDFHLLPPSNAQPSPEWRAIRSAAPGRLSGHAWEQVELPLRAQRGTLLNLCNLGPVAARGGLIMMHDAQVYLTPESYSPAFVACYRVAHPMLAKNSARILTVSEYSKDTLMRQGLASADKISVIYNGVDHMQKRAPDFSVFERLRLKPRGFVLALSSVQAHKNIAVLLDAFGTLPELTLVLAGKATRAEFEAAGHILPPNVVIAGTVSDSEFRGLMERALCFACPSLTEGFGLPPLEAMSVGCPAIAAPCGSLPEVCAGAVLYADARSPRAWTARIRDLAADPAQRDALSAQGLVRASAFTWRKSALQLAQAMRETL